MEKCMIINNPKGLSFNDIPENKRHLPIKIYNDSCEWYGVENVEGIIITEKAIYINFCGEFDITYFEDFEKAIKE